MLCEEPLKMVLQADNMVAEIMAAFVLIDIHFSFCRSDKQKPAVLKQRADVRKPSLRYIRNRLGLFGKSLIEPTSARDGQKPAYIFKSYMHTRLCILNGRVFDALSTIFCAQE